MADAELEEVRTMTPLRSTPSFFFFDIVANKQCPQIRKNRLAQLQQQGRQGGGGQGQDEQKKSVHRPSSSSL